MAHVQSYDHLITRAILSHYLATLAFIVQQSHINARPIARFNAFASQNGRFRSCDRCATTSSYAIISATVYDPNLNFSIARLFGRFWSCANCERALKLRGLLSKGPNYREPVSYSRHQNFGIIMDACEEYAIRWAKKEDVEVDTLSEWIKSIADVLKRRIRRLKHSVNTRHESIFSDPDVVRELSRLRENFVIVPADKESNNYTFVCKRHYISILSEELGLNSLPGNPTYNLTDVSASEVLDNHKSVLTSFGIEASGDELDLPYIYWIPKMHKNPYKHRFIAGSSKYSTKPLSILLKKLLTHIKQGLQKYCETAYSRSGINQMWILKNSKELLEHLKSPTFNHVTCIKSFDFSTLYTTIPHQKLKDRLTSIIRNAFIFKNGNRRYKYLVLGMKKHILRRNTLILKTSTLKTTSSRCLSF